MLTRCARCHAPATHTARRHRVTIPMCQAHHRHVWAGLVADGWIISPTATSASAPIIWGNREPELYIPR